MIPPEYRVRVFLSVDLTGSTAHKKNSGSSFKWIKAFQRFYGQFPATFQEEYLRIGSDNDKLSDGERNSLPKVWKTIGDEILFVNRVGSVAQLGLYVAAFSKALHKFGESIPSSEGLNTKGNGWIAAFPSPNRSIGIAAPDGGDPLSGSEELPTEGVEAKVDAKPSNYDFLGSGIDGGFRIARNSTVDAFTISPALAYLLTIAHTNNDATDFEAKFRFHEMQSFKGVIGGKPYPIISIDTTRNDPERDLRRLETELLNLPDEVKDPKQLRTYLEQFIEHHEIEMPCLPLFHSAGHPPLPEHYRSYVKEWQDELMKSQEDLSSLEQDPQGGDDSGLPESSSAIQKVAD